MELVPLPDLENAEYKAKIDDPETFKFRRETDFKIVKDRMKEGVRLRIFSQSAIDHRQGIWFETVEDAKAAAKRDFGIAEEGWR